MNDNNTAHNEAIADMLFPDVTNPVDFFYKKYPPRNVAAGAKVTRFAPSPTGSVHIGSLFTALVSQRLAHHDPSGVFFLRLEDTDKKREVEGGVAGIIEALSRFSIPIDEGVISEQEEIGAYGPYKQSDRKDIYAAFIKHLISLGHAYPCFCTPEELEAARKSQEAQKIKPGYYGEWAKHRTCSKQEIGEQFKAGKPFVVRLRAHGSDQNKFLYKDLIKGNVTVSENDQDVVLLKSDGLPTYHFAHVVDDYLMHTTHVLRGDEWLSSLPIHLALFEVFGWQAPLYGHISPILKLDGDIKRKLSKRKDPEAAVSYYAEKGFPVAGVMEYLLNIANSDFEDWRKAHPSLPNTAFEIKLEKFNKSGALFDLAKLSDISKEVIARMSADEVYSKIFEWANTYDTAFAKRMSDQKDYFLKILSIERSAENPRKDISMWSEVKENIFYFFDDMFKEFVKNTGLVFPETFTVSKEDVKNIISAYVQEILLATKTDDQKQTRDEWFGALKNFGERKGFAKDIKEYKKNPAGFKGHIGDVAMILRVALTAKTRTPDLFEIMSVMGDRFVEDRLVFSGNLLTNN